MQASGMDSISSQAWLNTSQLTRQCVFLSARNARKRWIRRWPVKPLVVEHIDGDLPDSSEGLKQLADGYVSESFYNPADGKHWAKFIAVTDKAKKAIANGWKLSNAYKATELGEGGKWHAVDYQQEVLNGEYEHLALVQRPRYEASVILSPEEFKAYNLAKKAEITRLANSADNNHKSKGESTVLKLFTRKKVENSADFDEMMVILPKSGKELTLTELVTRMDKFENGEGFANPDHLVKVGNEEMSVKEMASCYGKMKASMEEEEEKKKNSKKKNAEETEEEKKKNAEAEEEKEKMKNMTDEEKAAMEKKKNEEKEAEEKKKNDAEAQAKAADEAKKKEAAEKKMNELEFERFKNKADGSFMIHDADTAVVLPNTGVKRGMSKYGG